MATTRAFADQLASQGAHQRAVLYYLACHDIYKAIEVFRKQAMYRCERRFVSFVAILDSFDFSLLLTLIVVYVFLSYYCILLSFVT